MRIRETEKISPGMRVDAGQDFFGAKLLNIKYYSNFAPSKKTVEIYKILIICKVEEPYLFLR